MSKHATRLAIVGLGKIARDQHVPTIASRGDFVLTAVVDPGDVSIADVPRYPTLDALLADGPTVDAVVLCTPPQARHALASRALAQSLHVFLEKPPGATLAEVTALERQAADAGRTLFAGWHSRYAAGVETARAWLASRTILGVSVVWREDVRVWHPGQAWIWECGGLGVFDPGINALSIVTQILPSDVFVQSAVLSTPSNRAAPIAAELTLRHGDAQVLVDFDWRQTGEQSWDITVDTDAGQLRLRKGGSVLELPDRTIEGTDVEYAGLYARFAELIDRGDSDVDCRPFQLVADAFLRGERRTTEPFEDG